MPQHFFLSKAARTISLSKVARMFDDDARDAASIAAIARTSSS